MTRVIWAVVFFLLLIPNNMLTADIIEIRDTTFNNWAHFPSPSNRRISPIEAGGVNYLRILAVRSTNPEPVDPDVENPDPQPTEPEFFEFSYDGFLRDPSLAIPENTIVEKIDWKMDYLMVRFPTQHASLTMLAVQDGDFFIAPDSRFEFGDGNFQSQSSDGTLMPSQFEFWGSLDQTHIPDAALSPDGEPTIAQTKTLDFSPGAAPINFGFTFEATPAADSDETVDFAVSLFEVRVHTQAVPEPSLLLPLFGLTMTLGLCRRKR